MASGKRASMREGPLAALFRKTEEGQETQQPAAPPPAEPPPSEPTAERVEPRTPTPTTRSCGVPGAGSRTEPHW